MLHFELILKYFPELSQEQIHRLKSLNELYADWNAKINVISRKDIDDLYLKHILHSLSIAKIIQFKRGSSMLDVGTGGGFPGIPLAILFPECQFHLVDSIGKKIKVVKAVADALGLKNVRAEQIRAEQIKDKYDFILSRAVTQFSDFYQWVKDKSHPININELKNGILYLKGGDLKQELNPFGKKIKIFDLSSYFEEAFFESKKIVYMPLTK